MLEWVLHYWMGIAFGALSGAVIALWQQLKAYRKGLIALLYNHLVSEHEKYKGQGWIPLWAMENFSHTYLAYATLEKNPAMEKLYEELTALPCMPPNDNTQ